MSEKKKSRTGASWRDIIPSCVYAISIILQIILAFIFYNYWDLEFVLYIGWTIFLLSFFLGFISARTLNTKGGVSERKSFMHTTVLVDSGIYAIVRHPMYVAGLLNILALILISQHWLSVISGVIALVSYYVDALMADKKLIDKFGNDYECYMQKVPRMNPLVGIIRLGRRRR